ncbi:MAG: rhomboid family intramembrane serine protease [Blastocatellia bacterium]
MQGESYETTEPRPFRLCERCGRPTPANLPQCVNCGEVSLPAVVADEEARAERRFAQAFFSRATPVTYALLAANVGVFLLMLLVSGGSDDPETLIAFGAKTNRLVREGDWYRLVTPIFIHAGLIHLLSNSYALWVVGPQVEKLYGSARFLLIYLLAGIGGVVGSYVGQEILNKPNVPSVGASGAIFGLFGVLAVFGYRYRHELPGAFRRAFGAGVLPVIVINLIIGFSIPFIDNSAHIGGLITGAILTFIVPYIAPGAERVSKAGLLIMALCVVVIGYCFAQAYRDSRKHLNSYRDTVNVTQTALNRAFDATLSTSSPAERGEVVAQLDGAIEKLENTDAPDERSNQLRLELLRITRQQQSLMTASDVDRRGDEIEANSNDFARVWGQLKEWVESEGSKYGLTWGTDEKQSK